VNDLTFYRPAQERLLEIFRDARLVINPEEMTKLHINIHPTAGCEILQVQGSTKIPCLNLGQMHTFFAQIKVLRSVVQEIDLDKQDPIQDQYLSIKNMRVDLENAKSSVLRTFICFQYVPCTVR
jgi:hypothetical protein